MNWYTANKWQVHFVSQYIINLVPTKAVVYTRDKTKSSLYGFEKFQNTVGIPDQLEGAIVDAGQLAVSEVFLERFAEQFRGGKEGGLATVKWLETKIDHMVVKNRSIKGLLYLWTEKKQNNWWFLKKIKKIFFLLFLIRKKGKHFIGSGFKWRESIEMNFWNWTGKDTLWVLHFSIYIAALLTIFGKRLFHKSLLRQK